MSGAVTASVIGGTIAAGAGLGSAAIQSHAAGKAASTQAEAAQQAAEYAKQASGQAVDYQKGIYGQTQQNLSPWMQSGQGANSQLSYLLGIGGPQQNTNTPYSPGTQPQSAQVGNTSTLTNPITGQSAPNSPVAQSYAEQGGQFGFNPSTGQGTAIQPAQQSGGMVSGGTVQQGIPSSPSSYGGYGSLLTPYQGFEAPTGLTMENDPGYQARLNLGTDAIQRSAAARGNLVTGGTAKALDTYAQDYASNEYGNVYNRALQGYQTNAGNYYTGQNNAYSRLLGLSQNGQQAADALGSLGQSAANNVSSSLMSGANAVNQQNNNAAAATASGYASQGNIWGNAVSGAGNNIGNLYALQNSGNPYQTLYNAQNVQGNSNLSVTNPSLSSYQIPYKTTQNLPV